MTQHWLPMQYHNNCELYIVGQASMGTHPYRAILYLEAAPIVHGLVVVSPYVGMA